MKTPNVCSDIVGLCKVFKDMATKKSPDFIADMFRSGRLKRARRIEHDGLLNKADALYLAAQAYADGSPVEATDRLKEIAGQYDGEIARRATALLQKLEPAVTK